MFFIQVHYMSKCLHDSMLLCHARVGLLVCFMSQCKCADSLLLSRLHDALLHATWRCFDLLHKNLHERGPYRSFISVYVCVCVCVCVCSKARHVHVRGRDWHAACTTDGCKHLRTQIHVKAHMCMFLHACLRECVGMFYVCVCSRACVRPCMYMSAHPGLPAFRFSGFLIAYCLALCGYIHMHKDHTVASYIHTYFHTKIAYIQIAHTLHVRAQAYACQYECVLRAAAAVLAP